MNTTTQIKNSDVPKLRYLIKRNRTPCNPCSFKFSPRLDLYYCRECKGIKSNKLYNNG